MTRTGFVTDPSHRRTAPLLPPPTGTTLHALGDIHYGVGGIASWRGPRVQADVSRTKPLAPKPAATVMLGDLSNNATTADDANYLAWEATMPTSWPLYKALGNHDVLNDARTPDQAAAALGLPARNYTIDLGGFILAVLFPGDSWAAFGNGSQMSSTALTWLDGVLASAVKPVVICCHFPLYNTVGGVEATQYLSTDAGFYVASIAHTADSTDVLSILDSRPTAKVWLSGHTHSNIDTPGLVGLASTGTRQIATVNASAIVSNDRAGSNLSRLGGVYLTLNPDDSVEVRWRDHGCKNWTASQGATRVVTLEPT